jgi:GntR family transcriptional repressor for pyruvate dehydrogenase complex
VTEPLEPLSPTRRADGVFEQLRLRILSGVWPAGARLPNERDLAEQLEVNRGSVREALKRLEFLELVEVKHGQGTFVRDPGGSSALQLVELLLLDPRTVTPQLLEELLAFRRDMTRHVVALAARHRSDAQLARARALLAEERASSDDPLEALRIDVELNRLLGEATGNLLYRLLSNLFTRLIRRLGPLYYNRARNAAHSLATHRELLDAIEARDEEAARSLVSRMLDYSEAAIRREMARLEEAGAIGPDAAGAGPTG